MKYLFVLIVFFQINALASNCYVINQSKVEIRTHAPQASWKLCPMDSESKSVTNIKDISFSSGFPFYDADKRAVRLQAETDARDAESNKRADLDINRVALVGLYKDIDSANTVPQLKAILKRLTKHVLRE